MRYFTGVMIIFAMLALAGCGQTTFGHRVSCSASAGIDAKGEIEAMLGCSIELDERAAKPVSATIETPAAVPGTALRLDTDQLAVRDLVQAAARAAGIDPVDFVTVAWIESRLRADAKNPRSTASGVMQFIASSARAYGLTDPFDARANVEAGIRLWLDNKRVLERGLGRTPTGAEMYLAHQQGAGGALRLIHGEEVDAASLVGRDAIALNQVAPSESVVSARAFVEDWTARFLATRARFTAG